MIRNEVWLGGSRRGEGKGAWKVSWVVKEPQSKKHHPLSGCLPLSPRPYFLSIFLSMKETKNFKVSL